MGLCTDTVSCEFTKGTKGISGVLGDYTAWQRNADSPFSSFGGLKNCCWSGSIYCGGAIRGTIQGAIGNDFDLGLTFPFLILFSQYETTFSGVWNNTFAFVSPLPIL